VRAPHAHRRGRLSQHAGAGGASMGEIRFSALAGGRAGDLTSFFPTGDRKSPPFPHASRRASSAAPSTVDAAHGRSSS